MHKLTFKAKEEAPEGLRDFLKETSDKSAFEVTLVPQQKLSEFRENNIRIAQEKDSLAEALKPFKSLAGTKDDGSEVPLTDLAAQIVEWQKTAQLVKDGKLKGDDAISKEIDARVERMKASHEEQLRAATTEGQTWKSKYEAKETELNQSRIDNTISQIAARADIGMNMEALPDVLRRARDEFVFENGKLVVKKDGAILRGEDGIAPLTPEEWVKGLRKSASYYFKGSTGGGAGGGDGDIGEYGMSAEALAKLSPEARLEIANKHSSVRRVRR